ncbi:MAG: hypothetical protein CVU39_24140 [Chloroflexi bacterium HGW-Chloroflexi-10]|nr:MAG: hypothetical protein CVU39_24140 [Chloroflexi bacterium HGW-Chloroflexi-10]
MKLKVQTWQTLRKWAQRISILMFVILLVISRSPGANVRWASVFQRLDPLTTLTATLAGQVVIIGTFVSLITLLLTLVFGRVWCGWLCPMGTVLDWFKPKYPRSTDKVQVAEKWRNVKYFLLIFMLVAALLGNQSLLIFDPITVMTRFLATGLWPVIRFVTLSFESFMYQWNFLWPVLDPLHNNVIQPVFGDIAPVFTLAVPLFLFIAVIVGLNWIADRFWCRYLCPLGALLGWISRFAFLRRVVDAEACNGCRQCARLCPTSTIDARRGFESDPAECIVCVDCLVDCKQNGTSFQWQIPHWKPAVSMPYDPTRRQALLVMGSAVVGTALTGVEPILKRQPADLIRPPGARITDFEKLCIRCSACINVCPTQGLQPCLTEGGWQNLLTPKLMPRLGYCNYNCTACGTVCPTGAIPLLSLVTKQTTVIGLARVDRNRCLPWSYATNCIVCEEACPLPDKAIHLEEVEGIDSEGNSILLKRPVVVRTLCIGCGMCEQQCPMGGEAAIRVFSATELTYL